MRKIFFNILCLVATFAGSGQYISTDNSGRMNIKWSAPDILFPGLKIYAGEKILIGASGQVNKNPYRTSHEDCFLFFCETYHITHNDWRSPGQIDATVLLKNEKTGQLLESTYTLLPGGTYLQPPATASVDHEFLITGFVSEQGVNRSASNGQFTLSCAIDNASRLTLIKSYLGTLGASLNYNVLANAAVIDKRLKERHAADLAEFLTNHLNNHASIALDEKKRILDFAYNLDRSNTGIVLALARNALQQSLYAEATTYVNQIIANPGNHRVLADAYQVLGTIYEERSAALSEADINQSAIFYGMAAGHYGKQNKVEQQAAALAAQANMLAQLRSTANLLSASKQLQLAEQLTGNIYVFTSNNKYGFLSADFREIANARFDALKTDEGGFIPAKENNMWGYVNRLGSQIIAAQFDEAWGFHGGLARVKKNNRLGYINSSGNMIIAAQYVHGSDFYQKLAIVLTPANQLMLIDEEGNKIAGVSNREFVRRIYPLSSGNLPDAGQLSLTDFNTATEYIIRSLRRRLEIENILFIDVNDITDDELYRPLENGSRRIKIIDKNFKTVKSFSEQIKTVLKNGNVYEYVLANNAIRFLTSDLVELDVHFPGSGTRYISAIGNGYFSFTDSKTAGKRYGIFNQHGQILCDMIYDEVHWSYNDLFHVKKGNTVGLVNKAGRFVYQAPPTARSVSFEMARDNSYHETKHIAVTLRMDRGFKYGLLNQHGQVILPANYTWIKIYDTTTNLIMVDKGPKSQLLKNNVPVFPLDFDRYWPVEGTNLCIIENDEKQGLFTQSGKMLLPLQYDDLEPLGDTLFIACRNDRYGVVTISNKVHIPYQYESLDEIEMYNPGFISLFDEPEEEQPNAFAFQYRRLLVCEDSEARLGVIDLTTKEVIIQPSFETIGVHEDILVCEMPESDTPKILLKDLRGNNLFSDTAIGFIRADNSPFLVRLTMKQFSVLDGRTRQILMQADMPPASEWQNNPSLSNAKITLGDSIYNIGKMNFDEWDVIQEKILVIRDNNTTIYDFEKGETTTLTGKQLKTL